MNSFFFWLTVAASLGAILGAMIHPGVLEIVIVLALLNATFYGVRSLARNRRQRSAV